MFKNFFMDLFIVSNLILSKLSMELENDVDHGCTEFVKGLLLKITFMLSKIFLFYSHLYIIRKQHKGEKSFDLRVIVI